MPVAVGPVQLQQVCYGVASCSRVGMVLKSAARGGWRLQGGTRQPAAGVCATLVVLWCPMGPLCVVLHRYGLVTLPCAASFDTGHWRVGHSVHLVGVCESGKGLCLHRLGMPSLCKVTEYWDGNHQLQGMLAAAECVCPSVAMAAVNEIGTFAAAGASRVSIYAATG